MPGKEIQLPPSMILPAEKQGLTEITTSGPPQAPEPINQNTAAKTLDDLDKFMNAKLKKPNQTTVRPQPIIRPMKELQEAPRQQENIDYQHIEASDLDQEAKTIARQAANSGVFQVGRLPRPHYTTETIRLPSEGRYYPPSSSLHSISELTIRHLCTEDEDILTTPSYIRSGKVLDILLNNCVLDKNVDLDDLLLGDKDSLMISLRITGFGSKYNATISCAACGKSFENDFDLSLLQQKELKLEQAPGMANAFVYTLPETGYVVIFRLMTSRDDKELDDQIKAAKKLNITSNTVTTRLCHYTISINGVKDKQELKAMIASLPIRDGRSYRKYINENQPGLDMRQMATCPECGEASVYEIPIGIEFFWPKL